MPDKLKSVKYPQQQRDIFNRLLEILNYNGNHTFLLTDFEKREGLQDAILELSPEIRKYYSASGCAAVNGTGNVRPCLCIIRYLLRFHKWSLFSKQYYVRGENETCEKTIQYTIIGPGSGVTGL